MPDPDSARTRLRVSELRAKGATPFELVPDSHDRQSLANRLAAEAIRKLRFAGQITPLGSRGWHLKGRLGATVVQPCIVSLEPVTTRIETEVERRFVPAEVLEQAAAQEGAETEMPEDDTLEPLGPVIDLMAVMAEALALAMPAYPRKEGAELETSVFAKQGVAPLRDDDVKPFAGLAALRGALEGADKAPTPPSDKDEDDKS